MALVANLYNNSKPLLRYQGTTP